MPEPGEVLVKVHACGLNRADLLQRQGHYPAPPGVSADVPGLELAGEIHSIGIGLAGLSVGDRVMAIVSGGGMSEFVCVPAGQLMPIPEAMSFEQAAAVPEAFLTAFDAIVSRGGGRSGEVLLVHAAASGVGTAGLQIGRALGMNPIATTRTAAKVPRLAEQGARHALLVENGRFASEVRELAPSGAHVILDFVGAAYLEENLRAVASGGRIVAIGLLGGSRGEISLGHLLAKRASLIGTVLRSRSEAEKAALVSDFGTRFGSAFATGTLRPVLESVLPIEEIAAAHRRLASNESFGKIVLRF